VVGLSGWSGEAYVYDIKTGENKFVLKANTLEDTPEPFSWDNVIVWLGKSIIVTFGTNDNTLTVWDRSGNLLAQDLHKDKEKIAEMKRVKALGDQEKEAYFEEKTGGMSEEEQYSFMMQMAFGVVPNDKKIVSLAVKEDTIYAGYEKGILIFGNVDGDWKEVKNIELNYEANETEHAGEMLAIGKVTEGKKVFSLFDPENPELGLKELKTELKYFSSCTFVYPHIFMIGGRGEEDRTGVEIWNIETGEMVRHLLKGEKRYESIHTNGKFFVVSEFINSYSSGDEKTLKVAVYNVEQVLDQGVSEEDLWKESFEYAIDDLTHMRAVLNDKNMVISNDKKFVVMEINEGN